ncbi:MAG: ArsC/Spx/MgsR family protein [Aquihabitans sp.]
MGSSLIKGLDAGRYTTPDAVADLLVEHPRLMQRPVLVQGDRASSVTRKTEWRPSWQTDHPELRTTE